MRPLSPSSAVWAIDGVQVTVAAPIRQERAVCNMKYDVFISFKNSGKDGLPTPDYTHARAVYEALMAIGLKVFFSEASLAEAGQGNFSRSIETALESARILILVASCRERIESRWVEAEWDSFLQDLRSGNKQGELFILSCGNLSPADLPLFLPRQQMFPADGLDKLVKFVGNAMPRRSSLRDFIRGSLHCFHPEKDEDKVYLLTVHPGSNADTYHVTAYWGARTAKRLNSQMKVRDISAGRAQLEVEKEMKEKLRYGYVEKPFARILTPEARSLMSASLGLHEAPRKGRPGPCSRLEAAPIQRVAASCRRDGRNSGKAQGGISRVWGSHQRKDGQRRILRRR